MSLYLLMEPRDSVKPRMPKVRRQHYVPRFHLAAWADKTTKLIRQYDLERSAENEVAPKNTAVKKWLYELSEGRHFDHGTQAVEKWFADLEARVSGIIHRFTANADEAPVGATPTKFVMHLSEQMVLSEFMITLARRHPEEIETNARTHESLLHDLGYVPGPAGIYVPSTPEGAKILGRDLALASLTKSLKPDHPIVGWAWRTFTLPPGTPHHFITSDRPVVRIMGEDGDEILGLQFALGPRHLVTCTPNRLGELEYEGLTQTYCSRLLNASPKPRFVYSTHGLDPLMPTAAFSETVKRMVARLDGQS